MKHLLLIATFIFGLAFTTMAQTNSNHVYVNGYTKSNGTYVNGYTRTAPNSTINDNFSTYPNTNPYTGQTGTIRPTYTSPTYSNPFNSNAGSTYNTPTYTIPTYTTPSYYNN